MKLPTHGRYDYVPITRRPVYDWPEGKRLAVFFCNNIEQFAFDAGLGADPGGADRPQSQSNYAWRDYGNRVGLWYYPRPARPVRLARRAQRQLGGGRSL